MVEFYFFLLKSSEKREIIILDAGGSYICGKAENIEDSEKLVQEISKDAVEAVFNQTEKGYELQDRIKNIFKMIIQEQLMKEWKVNSQKFDNAQFIQKCSISRNGIVCEKIGKAWEVFAKGTVIRWGNFHEKEIVTRQKFEVHMELAKNPDLLGNKRYPYIVQSFTADIPNENKEIEESENEEEETEE